MKKRMNKFKIAIIVFFLSLILSNISNASELQLQKLEYNVILKEDGTAEVTEKWNIWMEDTNTLFKTFEIDKQKYSGITDVTVKEIYKNGDSRNFTKINQEKYHVDRNCYYALKNSKGKFEIAWGVHAEQVTKQYEISYKIVDAVCNYLDCSEFYWQFISTESAIPAKQVIGTITLPKPVSNKEDLKVWAHGPLNGNITIVSNDTVKFEIEKLGKNTMLEARIVTPTNIFANNQNTKNQNKSQSILLQEQKWADEANAKREKLIEKIEFIKRAMIVGLIISNIIGIILCVKVCKKIKKYRKELKENPIFKPEMEIDYFRDIPDEKETPARSRFFVLL